MVDISRCPCAAIGGQGVKHLDVIQINRTYAQNELIGFTLGLRMCPGVNPELNPYNGLAKTATEYTLKCLSRPCGHLWPGEQSRRVFEPGPMGDVVLGQGWLHRQDAQQQKAPAAQKTFEEAGRGGLSHCRNACLHGLQLDDFGFFWK